MKKMLKLSILLMLVHVTLSNVLNERGRPNVIIMHVNNLQWNDVGVHVNKADNENATPNIDRLGYAGIILNRFYSNGGKNSLYSGCYRRSSHANFHLLTTFFERNGYKLKSLDMRKSPRSETFENEVVAAISDESEPLLLTVDFGELGTDVKISFIDEIVGAVVMKAHEANIIDNTIIFFISLPSDDTNEVDSSPLEINIRKPAIIYSRLLSQQQHISNELFHVIDILPTLINATDLKWLTKDRYFIDGVNQWTSLNIIEDDARTSVYGDNFYIDHYWKLSYGAETSVTYGSISNENMESSVGSNFDFKTYVNSVLASEIDDILDDVNGDKIMLIRNRAKVHCNVNDINETFVMNIRCSRATPCLFDLQSDPCEFDDKHEHEYDRKRLQMSQIYEQYLEDGIIRDSSVSLMDDATTHGHDDEPLDPLLTSSGGFGAFLTLMATLFAFIGTLVLIACIKERCNSRRSVYHSKKVTFKDESDITLSKDPFGISTISSQVEQRTRL